MLKNETYLKNLKIQYPIKKIEELITQKTDLKYQPNPNKCLTAVI